MTANYYRNAHAVIFVYSVEDEGTLYALNEWVREARAMSRQPERLVLALWGSKCDLEKNGHIHTVKQEAVDAFTITCQIPPHLNCKVSVFGNSAVKAMNELVEHIDRQFSGSAGDTQQGGFDTLTPHLVPPENTEQKGFNCCGRN